MTESAHASIRLIESNCTSCYICARECPSWCISIEAHAETVAQEGVPAARRQRAKAVLDRFTIDFTDCMYCGICVEECPFDALEWTDAPLPAPDARSGLVLTKEQLGTLPPPGASTAVAGDAPAVHAPAADASQENAPAQNATAGDSPS